MTCVLDASAVIALLYHKTGAEAVERELPDLVISAVNLSEAVAWMAERGASEGDVNAILDRLSVPVFPFTAEDAVAAGLLRPDTRSRGLSLGDRACIALGIRMGYRVLTADRAWSGLDLGVDLGLVR